MSRDVLSYEKFLSNELISYLQKKQIPAFDIPGLTQVGEAAGLETKESLEFLVSLYNILKVDLNSLLEKRVKDREFIDSRTKVFALYNLENSYDLHHPDYKTVLGAKNEMDEIVFGPISADFAKPKPDNQIAKLPAYLEGKHITLFGPPDSEKLAINAMNCFHRKLKVEPAIIQKIIDTISDLPKWGADDEDSKTPIRRDLQSAGVNLTNCFNKSIKYQDAKTNQTYELEKNKLATPFKRFPGLALPCNFLFLNQNPLPLHLYDFALHLFANWNNPEALCFYVPKLENENEARYVKKMFNQAELLISKINPSYKMNTIRCLIVLENPRAIVRTHEIMDELHPYFAGASLGWHDYLASTARLFKEDPQYRIPVKADPNIVIKYIKVSHELLNDVVGSRGGVKIGGMYGILPLSSELESETFQITLLGFFKDTITQLKRGLSGFWVAHPDFVRIGMCIAKVWDEHKNGNSDNLNQLIKSLLSQKYEKIILDFIKADDVESLDVNHPRFTRSLIVADLKESDVIANCHPEEIRYNVFQTLQYLTDWLSGNGCVALPTTVEGIAARVMDDLATAERSRWEVWLEIYHGRVSCEEFLKIAHEEMNFIRRDQSNDKKIVQVKYTDKNAKWYEVAFNLMIKLMTDSIPCEFATELLLPFTNPDLQNSENPWQLIQEIDSKYKHLAWISRFNFYFEICGHLEFAKTMSFNLDVDLDQAREFILCFSKDDINEAASFHGDIGQSTKTLDAMAKAEQANVLNQQDELLKLGVEYNQKFGMKFLISAKGKSGDYLLAQLLERMNNSLNIELVNAREALWEISKKRFESHSQISLKSVFEKLRQKYNVTGAQISLEMSGASQNVNLGTIDGKIPISDDSIFQIASLSKTISSVFCVNYFERNKISLDTSVNQLFEKIGAKFRLKSDGNNDWADKVTLRHLMQHSSLNMHYVNGVPLKESLPEIGELILGSSKYKYEPVSVINDPGRVFKYSGAGFMVLEYLIESLEGKKLPQILAPFFDELGLENTTTNYHDDNLDYAVGFTDEGKRISGERLQFPTMAAGILSTAENMNRFLTHMLMALNSQSEWVGITYNSIVTMMEACDLGCVKFMGSRMGLGVFVMEAGDNKFLVHQGANDGFRALFLFCMEGPDAGKGFTLLCNSELNGIKFISECAQYILEKFNFSGIDFSKFVRNFETSGLKQEEIVNIGYKTLIFDAFTPDLPLPIERRNILLPLSKYNFAPTLEVVEVSNQKFSRATNLISPYEPEFDPTLFERQGKVMDSWESVRHNQFEYDYVVLKLPTPKNIKYLTLSTKYHHGNQMDSVEIEAKKSDGSWDILLPKTKLQGHSLIKLHTLPLEDVSELKVKAYPDGGLTRLQLFTELPEVEEREFNGYSKVFEEKIPTVIKPSGIEFDPSTSEIKLISVSNQHYGHAHNILSPYAPINMFDGFESARSRTPNHHEEIVLEFPIRKIQMIEIDFHFFKNNNPMFMGFAGFSNGEWTEIVTKTPVKAFAGKVRSFYVDSNLEFSKLKIFVYPDGGFNRIKIY